MYEQQNDSSVDRMLRDSDGIKLPDYLHENYRAPSKFAIDSARPGLFDNETTRRVTFIVAMTSAMTASGFFVAHQMKESDAQAAKQKADKNAFNLKTIEEEERRKEAQAAIERAKDAEEAKRLVEAEKLRQREQKDIWKQDVLVMEREYEVHDDTLNEISEGGPKVYRVRFESHELGSRFHVDDSTSLVEAKDWLPLKGDFFPPVFVGEVKKDLNAEGEEVIVVIGAGNLGLKPGRSFWTKRDLLQACRDLKNGRRVQYKIKRDNPEASDMDGFITPIEKP